MTPENWQETQRRIAQATFRHMREVDQLAKAINPRKQPRDDR
jgi:hypothetical protein